MPKTTAQTHAFINYVQHRVATPGLAGGVAALLQRFATDMTAVVDDVPGGSPTLIQADANQLAALCKFLYGVSS